jgi:hypothetical protein
MWAQLGGNGGPGRDLPIAEFGVRILRGACSLANMSLTKQTKNQAHGLVFVVSLAMACGHSDRRGCCSPIAPGNRGAGLS